MGDYVLYRIGKFIAMHIPLKLAYKLAIFFSDVHFIFANKDRATVLGNLKVIFPEKSVREIRRIRIRMFRNFAKYLVDFFRFEKLTKEEVAKNVKVLNRHYLDQALARNKGVIVLSAHIGNWELGGAVVALAGYPIWVVAMTHKYKKVNDFFVNQRKNKGINVIPMERAVKQCLTVLNENKLLGLIGDRDFTERGITEDFFGKPMLFPVGPAGFALKTGAAIVPTFIVRNPDDNFTLMIEKPIIVEPSISNKNGGDEKLRKVISQYKIIFEEYIRKYPDQWYMFRKFWKD
ncbi:MAG: hypothetical protein DRP74_05500 [Candidatus Omnitrophota bacterium]|nr:MAG: hypothetical protein DRP74_05500 [Candidatus Omnitrophota bacterium]